MDEPSIKVAAVSREFHRAVAAIGGGMAARLYCGAVLGAFIAFAIQGGTGIFSGAKHIGYMSVAAGLLILAAISPHLDTWLGRLNGLKTSVIELQLADVAKAHKLIASRERPEAFDIDALNFITAYKSRIDEDYSWFDKFEYAGDVIPKDATCEQPNNSGSAVQQHLCLKQHIQEVRKTFENVLEPLASCLRSAMDRGLSLSSARLVAQPLASAVEQIAALAVARESATNAGDVARLEGDLRTERDKLKQAIMAVRSRLAHYWAKDPPECAGKLQKADNFDIPDHTKYRDLPYLHVVMAATLAFTNDTNAALRIVQQARQAKPPVTRDYLLLYLEARLRENRLEPAANTMPLLEEMKTIAEERYRRVIAECPELKCKDPSLTPIAIMTARRARHVIAIALNQISYDIAQDIVADMDSARPLQAIAEDYAEQLQEILKKDRRATEASGELQSNDERLSASDTVAFVSMMTEAGKSVPDLKKIKKAADTFKDVIAYYEANFRARESNGDIIDPRDLLVLRLARAHLTAARQMTDD